MLSEPPGCAGSPVMTKLLDEEENGGGNRQVKIEDLNLVNAWKEFSIFVGLF